MCTCAETGLNDTFQKIETGDIKLYELLEMKEKHHHVELLIDASSPNKNEAEVIKQLLKERYDEHTQLIKRAEHLGELCQSIIIPVKGMITRI